MVGAQWRADSIDSSGQIAWKKSGNTNPQHFGPRSDHEVCLVIDVHIFIYLFSEGPSGQNESGDRCEAVHCCLHSKIPTISPYPAEKKYGRIVNISKCDIPLHPSVSHSP